MDITRTFIRRAALALAALSAAGGAQALTPGEIAAATKGLDTPAIIANAAQTENWPTYGLDYQETRYSKLDQITSDNVGELGLA